MSLQLLNKILPWLKNKYVYTSLAFIIWMLFFDRNNVISQFELRSKLNQLQEDRTYYIEEMKKDRQDMKQLLSNPKNLEKFAREKYLMKKDNEDIFLIVKK
jgi:cell division protein FtsB